MQLLKKLTVVATFLLTAIATSAQAQDYYDYWAHPIYYIGVDSRHNISNADNRANPNLNRLTLLLAHVYPTNPPPGGFDFRINHYHRLGAYGYAPGTSDIIRTVNGRIPEGAESNGHFATLLRDGDVFRSGVSTGEYERYAFTTTDYLRAIAGPRLDASDPNATPEGVLYYSSPFRNLNGDITPRYTTSLGDTRIGLRLESISENFHFGTALGAPMQVGDVLDLGLGSALAANPLNGNFWVNSDLADLNAVYRASFSLTDLSGNPLYGDSGLFTYTFQASVPEPSAYAAFLLGAAGMGGLLAKRRRAKARN